jgi:hypothetical protein
LDKIPILFDRLQHVEFMGWHLLLPFNWVWTQVARKRKSHKWWELKYFLLWPQFTLQNFSWRKTTNCNSLNSPNMYLLVSNIFMSITKNLESFLCVLNVLILMRTCLKLHVFTECNTLTKLANGLPSINTPFFSKSIQILYEWMVRDPCKASQVVLAPVHSGYCPHSQGTNLWNPSHGCLRSLHRESLMSKVFEMIDDLATIEFLTCSKSFLKDWFALEHKLCSQLGQLSTFSRVERDGFCQGPTIVETTSVEITVLIHTLMLVAILICWLPIVWILIQTCSSLLCLT